jgi:hypothetical protein
MRKMKKAYKILVGKPERIIPFVRPRRRWEDNIRIDLAEIQLEVVDRMHLVQDRDRLWVLVNSNVPWGSMGGGGFLD